MNKFLYYLELILVTPFWLLSTSETKKSWKAFKSGLIKHKCEFDYTKPIPGKWVHYPCKHLGCNIVTFGKDE